MPPDHEGDDTKTIVSTPLPTRGEIDFRMIELMFFAYREFTADADSILETYGFGRAHHRILHFVNRSPGMTIADILDLLQITKQSLSRVLRQLVDGGFVRVMPGAEDKRQRRLYPTERGRKLALDLSHAQVRRIDQALAAATQGPYVSVTEFLRQMGNDRRSTREWFERQGIEEDGVNERG
ncbi:MarR family winged helix-turn-helix transcriptional regulator [Mangrovicella endophytica]|uniref:MarR family winged helix-turn-helix transcriptional regulator n=1 Tax=Mangrovicella endophytica TaxID=2066697 RepID=UPI003CC96F23